MSRILPFEAIDNFRDYGDYATGVGRRLHRRVLLRSAHHGSATEADLTGLAALNIGTIVDLRRAVERARQPSRRPQGFAGRVIEALPHPDDGQEAPHIAFLKSSDLTVDSGRRFMIQAYRRIPYEGPHLQLFADYFRALAEGEGPVLIHCAAGKDRTGVLAALTHRLVGVSEDDAIADYLMTNHAVRLTERAPEIARQIAAYTGRTPSEDAVVAFLGVEADFLAEAFATIDRESGSLDGYVRDALGLDPKSLRAALAERLLA